MHLPDLLSPNAARTALWGLAALVTAVLVLRVAPSRAADDAKPAATAQAALTVTTTRPVTASLALRLTAHGSLAPWQEAVVGAEVGGLRLTELRASVGDRVSAGQVLATLADDTVQAELAQARAALAEARATAAEAAANAQRARAVDGSGALSAQQIGQWLAADHSAQARVEAAQAALALQQLRLKHTRVLAPDSGVITARPGTLGAVVAPGQELFRLIRQGRLEWRAEVTSAELARLAPGVVVQVTAPSGVRVAGKLRTVAPTVDPQTRNALVYVDLPAHPQLRAGMFARGEFELGASNGLTLPQQALVVRDGFHYVFALDDQQRVHQRKVEVGRRVGDRVEVLAGVESSTVVAVRGAGFLNDADRVRVVNEAPVRDTDQKNNKKAS